MEKRVPHYPLSVLQARIQEVGIDALTRTAYVNARLMGMDTTAILATLQSMRSDMFFKSMTTHTDHRIWQDVYHVTCPSGKIAYVKLTLRAHAVVIQFKEK